MDSIAIVVPELLPVPPVRGGAVEHWVDEAARRMASPDRRLAMVSRPAGIAGHGTIEYIGIPWTPLERFFHHIKERVTWKNPLRYLAKIQNVFSYGRRVAKVVRDFDVVYLHNEPNILLFLDKKAGQKIVLHMHNDHLSARLFRPFYRRALNKAHRIICVSDYIRRCAVASFPEYADKFSVIVNSTDPEIFRPYGNEALEALAGLVSLDPACRYLLYVGRLTEVKGVHVLIEAFQKIHARMPNTRLIITGSSFFGGAAKTAYEQKLVNLAEPVSDSIVFTGFLPHDKLRYLYSAVDVVCLPSVWQDPCPLVVFESLSSGSCLVASRVGGVPEVVVSGEDGILVVPDDPDGLADAVCDVLAHPEKKAEMERRGREKVMRAYTWERLVIELEIILND
ncbi:glycosyltransferase family 4 protein [Ferribacterium limneticum]|uniref:glycosyltransferase family 4 protein n=1 Tax=Ferribacterium limneticum TaxID=76259 RepID=UPI001CFA4AD5|nr:glycosyltransferase family 4 protein [Ferribacterium limneticum]UCV17255.1 glycosyltransferase family 4 protein [Ferribacterium limneticum]